MSFRNLFHLSSVVCLEIEDCVVSPDGVDVEYPFLENLTYLCLKDVTATEDGFSDELLFPLPTKLTFLKIVQNDYEYPCLDSQMLEKISSLSNLTHLSLGVNSAISNIGLSHLSSLQKLTYLDLGKKSAISDVGLSYLSSHSNLTYLSLGRFSSITDQGISHLSSCVNLTSLYFGPESIISYQGISNLPSLTMLSDISSLFSYE
jgi:hypothetical protein